MIHTCYLFSLMISLMASPASAENVIPNYYIEVDGKGEEKPLKYGELVYTPDYNVEKEEWSIDQNQMLESISQALQSQPDGKKDVMIYIHGLWGNTWIPFADSHKKMMEDIWNDPDSPFGMVISLVWDGGANYDSNVATALRSGEYLSVITQDIHKLVSDNGGRVSYMLHSMGHRVFQGIWSDEFETTEHRATDVVMMGSDLHTDTFEENNPMHHLHKFTDEIVVYVHNNDRTLGFSKAFNGRSRLGLGGVDDMDKTPDILTQVDVSTLTDVQGFGARFSNHRYYYASPTVRQDIRHVLWGDEVDKTKRSPLGHDRYLQLLPTEG